MRPDRLSQWEISMTSLGIEYTTFRLVVLCLNQLHYLVLPLCYIYNVCPAQRVLSSEQPSGLEHHTSLSLINGIQICARILWLRPNTRIDDVAQTCQIRLCYTVYSIFLFHVPETDSANWTYSSEKSTDVSVALRLRGCCVEVCYRLQCTADHAMLVHKSVENSLSV